MNLSLNEGKLFYDLYAAILSFVNRKLDVAPEQFSSLAEYMSVSPEVRLAIRDALFDKRELIDEFVTENPAQLSAEQLRIVSTWKDALPGKFYVFRYLKNHTVFLTSGISPAKAYGVVGLADPMEFVVGPSLPRLVTTVLLPFHGKIIYDGLVSGYNITFGGGIKRMLNEEYKQAKEVFGIITSLGTQAAALNAGGQKKRSAKKKKTFAAQASPANDTESVAAEITELTDGFCEEFLNEEYAKLCRELASALARKRPSPLLRGKRETWACGIVRTIGWVNYLDDPAQKPHMKLPIIDRTFGVAESTGQGKSKSIRKMLKIGNFDLRWTLPSKKDDNPRAWIVQVNGFAIDARYAPRDIQEAAFKKGLIPYVPADQTRQDA
jgi:hypothetical protein